MLYDYVPDVLEKRGPFREKHFQHVTNTLTSAAATGAEDCREFLLGGALFSTADDARPGGPGAMLLVRDFPGDLGFDFVRNDPYVVNGLVTASRVVDLVPDCGILYDSIDDGVSSLRDSPLVTNGRGPPDAAMSQSPRYRVVMCDIRERSWSEEKSLREALMAVGGGVVLLAGTTICGGAAVGEKQKLCVVRDRGEDAGSVETVVEALGKAGGCNLSVREWVVVLGKCHVV